MATVTGAASTPGRAALAELTGRAVLVWPDADDVGREHMRRVIAGLEKVGTASVRVIEWPDAPPHGDAADYLVGGRTAADVEALILNAHTLPIMPSRSEAPASVDAPDHLRGMNAAELLALDIPPMHQALAGLLPEGLGVLGAPPKAGKSLLAYQMAVELVLDGGLFGIAAERRPVRYYALEDGRRRSQTRIRALLQGRTAGLDQLDLQWTAPRLGGPLEAEIGAWLDGHPLGVVNHRRPVEGPGERQGRAECL